MTCNTASNVRGAGVCQYDLSMDKYWGIQSLEHTQHIFGRKLTSQRRRLCNVCLRPKVFRAGAIYRHPASQQSFEVTGSCVRQMSLKFVCSYLVTLTRTVSVQIEIVVGVWRGYASDHTRNIFVTQSIHMLYDVSFICVFGHFFNSPQNFVYLVVFIHAILSNAILSPQYNTCTCYVHMHA